MPAPSSTKSLQPATRTAYRADWAAFTRWCRMQGVDPLPPSPTLVARYITASALSPTTLARRLSGLAWQYQQRGFTLDRSAPQIMAAMAGARSDQPHHPAQKNGISHDDIRAMVGSLPHDLRGLRDRAMLLIGYGGGLRRSEVVGLDCHRDDTDDGIGWVAINAGGATLSVYRKTGWHNVTIGRVTDDQPCPIAALERWLHYARITRGPLFVGITRDGKRALGRRLNDKHVARLIKQTVLDGGVRADLPEKERLALFSGSSLRRR